MLRLRAAALALALVLPNAAQATMVRSTSGAKANVAPSSAPKFQCLVTALDRAGYKIKFMGGYGKRPNHSKHPSGHALDINQTARNRVIARFPSNINALAADCGLFHGAQWRRADAGHFEVPSSRYAGLR
jgi:hypothetical protein